MPEGQEDSSPSAAPQQLLQTPAASNAVILGLSQDLGALKNMVLDLVKQSRAHNNPQVPEELFEHYMNLIQNQVANELAEEVIKNIQGMLRPDQKKNPEIIREKLAEQLEKMMPVAGPIVRTKVSGPHVVALIGPTGVGKTTTVAKLAANLKLRENRRVGRVQPQRLREILKGRQILPLLDACQAPIMMRLRIGRSELQVGGQIGGGVTVKSWAL